MNETVQGWHFLAGDRRLGNGDGRLVEVGKTLSIPKERMLKLCVYGLHASERAIDALLYAPGPIACRVEVLGEVERDDEKLCGYALRCLAMADATATLHEFACRCAEQSLEHAGVDNPRCWGAIECKRRWMRGEATHEELLEHARAADRAAAGAAFGSASWAAARAAAGAAFGSASWAAARAAAWAAARAAARVASCAEARAWQNDLLEEMLGDLLREEAGE